jgi:GNAT superfamily N-acetyltransferase
MNQKIEFFAANAEELSKIVEMKITMFDEAGHMNLLAADVASLVLADYQRLYACEQAQHFVARANGRIIATVGAFLKFDLPFRYFRRSQYGFIGDVYTVPEFRGQKIATHLNEAALTWLRGRGVRMVRLLASQAGRPIYENLGFLPSDEMVLFLSEKSAD